MKGRKRKTERKKGKKMEKNTLWYCLERKRNFPVPFKSFSTDQRNSSPNAQPPRFEEEPAAPAPVGMNVVMRHGQVSFPFFFFFFGHHLYYSASEWWRAHCSQAGPMPTQTKLTRSGLAQSPQIRPYFGPISAQLFWVDLDPICFQAGLGPTMLGSTHIIRPG